jgi:hypothetical protein
MARRVKRAGGIRIVLSCKIVDMTGTNLLNKDFFYYILSAIFWDIFKVIFTAMGVMDTTTRRFIGAIIVLLLCLFDQITGAPTPQYVKSLNRTDNDTTSSSTSTPVPITPKSATTTRFKHGQGIYQSAQPPSDDTQNDDTQPTADPDSETSAMMVPAGRLSRSQPHMSYYQGPLAYQLVVQPVFYGESVYSEAIVGFYRDLISSNYVDMGTYNNSQFYYIRD